MTVFVYDNTKIDVFETFDGGDITVSSTENIDYGDINQTAIIERDANYFNIHDWGRLIYSDDIVPFGPINVVDGRDEFGRSRSQVIFPADNTVLFDVGAAALTSPVRIWVGTGTIHEIGSGLERLVIPDLGAAGPVIFTTTGVANESYSRTNYNGSGAIAKSGLSVTDLDQVYPWNGSGTLTLSGGTSTPYQDAYNPVIKNAAKIKGGYGRQYKNERVIFDYSRDPDDKWNIENNGVLVIREGSSFDDKLITFDETIINPLGKERSFADADALEYADYGNISDSVTSSEDRGIIPRKFGGQISLHEYQAYGISAGESRPFHFTGSGSIFKLAQATDIQLSPVITGSGTLGTFSGTNWFSQAPQSTFFGLEGKAEISGSAEEKFVPSTPSRTVLFDISGTGAESTVAQTPDRKITVRLTGSVSGIAIVTGSGDKSGTVLFDVSGGATKVATAKADGNINLFDITAGMTQEVPVFTPSWFSPMGNLKTEEVDWGLCVATPTSAENWGPIVTNDETIPKEAENWGFLLPEFNWVQLGGEHYPSLDSLSEGDTSLSVQTLGTTGIATFLLSEDLDVAAAIQYESSGKSGIATHNAGLFFSGELWLSQAPQHTVFGEEGKFTLSSTGNESITPWIPEGSGSLFAIGGSAESVTKAYLQGDYSYLGGTAGQTFSPHIDNTVEITLRTGREPGQTYARVVDTPELAFGGDINVRGGAIKVTNTDNYNETSIWYGQENENWGILDSDVSYGFGLNNLGTASGTETFDDESDTYDQDITFSNGGLTYDQGSGGNTILPSFDKTDQYDINFADTVVSQDWGVLGISSAGGPAYDQHLYPYYTGFTSQEINNGYHDYGWVNQEIPVETRYPFGSLLAPQPQPRAKTMWIPKWNGSGTLVVSGVGDERVAVASSTTTLFDFVGTTSPESFVAQTPENTVLYDTGGTLIESVTKDYVGLGSIALTQTQAVGFTTYRRVIFPPASGQYTLSGSITEKWSGDPPEGTYLHIVGGAYTDLKLTYATQSTKAVMRLAGELNHPEIDYTPHYGIDRNVGLETGFTLLPGGGTDRITGITTAVFVPKYPGGQSLLDGNNGHTREIIKIDGRSISRTNAPISTHGVIYILGIGTAGNGVGGPDEKGDLDGVEFGATWRFTPATEYGIGSIMFDFTGGAESREINVFGYYGDDKDPGTSGQITIRQEGGILTEEKIVRIYATDGTGAYTYEGGATDEATTFSEVGSGSLYTISGSSEAVAAAELVAGTSILNGTATESFTARDEVPWYQAPTVLTLSGTAKAQRRFEPVGSGTFTLSNSVDPVTGVRLTATGSGSLFGFGSGAEAVPYQGFASSVLVDIAGEADTRWFAVFQEFIPSGSLTFAGALAHPLIDFTPAETGGGFSTFFGTAETATTPREVGVGTFTAFGSAIPTFTSQGGEGTVLFDLKGASAITKLHWLYLPTTSGVTTLSGAGDTKEIQTYGYYGDDKDPGTSGTFTFSNTPLVHPFVDYTPSIGIGSAVLYSVHGSSTERRAWAPVYGTGYFKNLASSKEAYGKGVYVGVGRVQSYGIAPTEYLVFEEGRTYVVII